MRKLPFLNGIRAFEAAARAESFAKAASELHVTPAAVSRMVQLLEQRLGVPLFERKANRLGLTAAGRAYQAGLSPIFDQLANLTAQVTAMAGSRVLTVGVGPTFATRWLIPRLADFQKEAPDVEVRFATGGATVPYNDDWTCGIRLGAGDWPGFASEKLFAADFTPVCTPVLAKRLKTPDDLRNATLLRVAHAADEWPQWFKAAGVSKFEPKARSSNITARRCRLRPTASASRSASAPMSMTISRQGASLRRSRCRCRRASTGIWSGATAAKTRRHSARSAPGSVRQPAFRRRQ